jgi:hypothetical protein
MVAVADVDPGAADEAAPGSGACPRAAGDRQGDAAETSADSAAGGAVVGQRRFGVRPSGERLVDAPEGLGLSVVPGPRRRSPATRTVTTLRSRVPPRRGVLLPGGPGLGSPSAIS